MKSKKKAQLKLVHQEMGKCLKELEVVSSKVAGLNCLIWALTIEDESKGEMNELGAKAWADVKKYTLESPAKVGGYLSEVLGKVALIEMEEN